MGPVFIFGYFRTNRNKPFNDSGPLKITGLNAGFNVLISGIFKK